MVRPTSEDEAGGGPKAECPPATGEPAAGADDQEVDVWWGGYAPRTMLPSVVLCAVATLLVGGAAVYLWSAHGLPALTMRYALYGLLAVLWLLEFLLLGYRVVFFNYRLTNRRLYHDHGFRRALDTAVDLAAVTAVRVKRGPVERLLGVGRVLVSYQGSAAQAVVLEGVACPDRVAIKIRNWVEEARRRIKQTSEVSRTSEV